MQGSSLVHYEFLSTFPSNGKRKIQTVMKRAHSLFQKNMCPKINTWKQV